MAKSKRLLTVGEIARLVDEPLHRIEYIIRARNIQPIHRAGNARVFSSTDLDRIRAELNRRKGVDHE